MIWWVIIWRDVRRAFEGGGAVLPLVFFLLVATLFPFAVGPDAPLLAKTGAATAALAQRTAAITRRSIMMEPPMNELAANVLCG